MDYLTIFFIAIGLCMDTFAVSVTNGIVIKQLKIHNIVKTGFIFGFSQGAMLLIGWLAGIGFKNFVSSFDHWLAFIILTIIGSKMIHESVSIERVEKEINPNSLYHLLILSVATSIDALAVGFSFVILKISIITPVIIVGSVTFFVSAIAVYIGYRVGSFFEKKLEIAGGLILIAIGIKILIEHLR